MKVLHVAAYYPPYRVGGVGEIVRLLHHGLLERGHESFVLTSGGTGNDRFVKRICGSPLRFVVGLTAYATTARHFDVVHCQQSETVALPLMMKLLRIPTPVLQTFHVSYKGMADAFRTFRMNRHTFRAGWKGWRYRNVSARFHLAAAFAALRIADETSFVSKSSAGDVLGAAKASRANIVYNGTDERIANGKGTVPEPTDLLYVGNDSHRKRVWALPFLLERIRRTLPGTRLRMIGVDLKSVPRFIELLDEFDLRNAVISEGILPSSSDLHPYYEASKVLVMPSIYEGLPMVILEAFQRGMPCVATRAGGHPEVVRDGVNGFLVEKDDIENMAAKCVEMLTDDRSREKMGESARLVVEHRFDVSTMVDGYVSLYKRLVNG